jgi:hypothetical protein
MSGYQCVVTEGYNSSAKVKVLWNIDLSSKIEDVLLEFPFR